MIFFRVLAEPGVRIEIRVHLFLANRTLRLHDVFAFVFGQVAGVCLE